jgi:hypothetical protein
LLKILFLVEFHNNNGSLPSNEVSITSEI